MWAMWANILKNFVHGPSASVTFSRRPYPGAIKQTAIGHATCSHQPYRTLQCNTLVGGNVGSVHMTRSLVGRGHRPCGHEHAPIHLWTMWAMWTPLFNRSPNGVV